MPASPKILVIVESIDVDESSGSKANVAFIQNLKQAGYELRVYHYTLKDIHLPGIDCRAIKENRRSLLFFLSRTERYLRDYFKLKLHKPLQNKLGFSFTLFNDRNSIIKALKKDQDDDLDLVITLSKGGSFRPHHALLKRPELHSKWLAYMHDPYPMHHYPKPYTWFEPGHNIKESFVREISEKAAFSAFPSLLLLQWMGQFYPGFLKTGRVIPHQIINLDVRGIDLPPFFEPENFNLLHAGNLLGARNPEGLIGGFLKFLQNIPEAREKARLIFIGGNNERVQSAAEKHPSIFASESYLEFEQVYKMQTKSSVNVILEAKAEISPFLPGKFPHCIAAEKSILLLGPGKSEARRLLGYDYPYWSEIDDDEKIARLIGELYKCWKGGKNVMKFTKIVEYLSAEHLKSVIDGLTYHST